jgi:DNA-binding NtrC family response regulator
VNDLPDRITGVLHESSAATPKTRTNFRPLADELRDLERRRIIEALDACDGIQTRAAAAIGMPLRTFTFRMKQYGIDSRDRKR